MLGLVPFNTMWCKSFNSCIGTDLLDIFHQQGVLGPIPFNPWCPPPLNLKYWAWTHWTLGPSYYFYKLYWAWPHSRLDIPYQQGILGLISFNPRLDILHHLTCCIGPDPIQQFLSLYHSTSCTETDPILPHSGPNPTVLANARPGLASWGHEVAL